MTNRSESGNTDSVLERGVLESRLWHYRGLVLRTVDGDTVDVQLDLGFGHTTFMPDAPDRPHPLTCRIRFDGVDAPEKKKHTLVAGREAQAALDAWVEAQVQAWHQDRWPFIVRTGFSRHLERWVGEVFSRASGVSASDWLVRSGHAVRVGS